MSTILCLGSQELYLLSLSFSALASFIAGAWPHHGTMARLIRVIALSCHGLPRTRKQSEDRKLPRIFSPSSKTARRGSSQRWLWPFSGRTHLPDAFDGAAGRSITFHSRHGIRIRTRIVEILPSRSTVLSDTIVATPLCPARALAQYNSTKT